MRNDEVIPLTEFGRTLAPEQLRILRYIHDEMGYMCNACSEGLWCCVDAILGDIEYAPDTVPAQT